MDTSVMVDFVGESGDGPASRYLANLVSGMRAVITEPVVMELCAGARSDADRLTPLDRIAPFPVARTNTRVWSEAARGACRLKKSGLAPPPLDILMASAAMVCDLELVHTDAHLEMIAGVLPLAQRRVDL